MVRYIEKKKDWSNWGSFKPKMSKTKSRVNISIVLSLNEIWKK